MEIAFIPRIFVRWFSKEFLRQRDFNILLSNTLILLVFLFFQNGLTELLQRIPHFCLFNKVMGFDCPFCGTTRAFLEISAGRVHQGLEFNALSLMVFAFFVMQIPLRLFALRQDTPDPRIYSISRSLSKAIVIMLVMHWLIQIIIN
jgi:hypothetical protein